MKPRYLFTTLLVFFSMNGLAQNAVTDSIQQTATLPAPEKGSGNDDETRVFTKVEQEAEFPGGQAGWVAYVRQELGVFNPADNGAPKGKYQVMVRFIVDKQGAISSVRAETKFGYGMESKVIKMIERSPKWIPALQNGRAVNAYRRQPVTFVVE